jgi:uncharacterized protein (DUF2126 family)
MGQNSEIAWTTHTFNPRRGRLWFFPDESMYVYYTPTDWMPESPPPAKKETD